MQSLFEALSHTVEGAPLAALVAALVWGVLSILLSPCHLASIPLVVGFIANQQEITPRRAFWTALVFSLGILVTIGVIGVITSALGRMAGDLGGGVNYVVAVVFFVVGLHLLDVVPLNFSGVGEVKMRRRGLFAAFVLGLVFGIALGPCTFAYMAPVLATTFRVAASAPIFAAALLLAYGVGHCGVIVVAGTSVKWVQRYMKSDRASRGTGVLKKVCGVLVLAGGLYLIYAA